MKTKWRDILESKKYIRKGQSNKIKSALIPVEKTIKTGKTKLYYVKIEKTKPAKGFATIAPSKGGGIAVLSKKSSQSENYKVFDKIKEWKKEPTKEIVDKFVDLVEKTLTAGYGKDFMDSIDTIVIPPVTSGKDLNNNLLHMIVDSIATKHKKSYDPHLLGDKNFEAKKMPFAGRIKAYENYISDNKSLGDLKGHNMLLIDDIMTTGSTIKSLHNKLAESNNVKNLILFRNF
jgi:phosphoribosylpyrophosphate synthetase